ncbi:MULTISPECIES: cell division protein PerM [unclassified Nocardioides]|uniref:cell division protein PerM n=1 Tax=unclassified Nocardioides TaxID=2615069 RepID=UPI0030153321
MTSVLPHRPDATRARDDLRHRRPLVLLATLGGATAAAATLVVCLGAGVAGWFLTDAGAHGEPRDALRVGALGWLMGHGSGVHVQGTPVTAVPLALTLVVAWTIWRVATRVGDAVSGHGPDADAIADGERDWTVPTATGLFALGYAVVVVVTHAVAATPATDPSLVRPLLWTVLLCGLVGGSAVAVGSGRAAIWASFLPVALREAAATCRRILLGWALVAGLVLLAALIVDLDTAVNVMSQLHTDAGDATLFTLLSATVVPNAVIFSGSYLLGPGFAVGVGTLVSPSAVALGPLPMFPLLAALPDAGTPPVWTAYLMLLPPLVALVATMRSQRLAPTTRWDEGIIRGLAGGVLAGLLFGVLAALAGGAVGPGRMAEVGPLVLDTTVYAVTAFGLGGLLGGVLATALQRRRARRDAMP